MQLNKLYVSFIISILICGAINAQTPKGLSLKLIPFENFVGKNFHVPQSVKYDCSWTYVIVKVETDNTGKITSYKCLNDVSDSLTMSFKYLLGYRFAKEVRIKKRPVVFYVSFDNSEICTKPAEMTYLPQHVVELIFESLKRQIDENPKTVVLYTPIVFKYSKVQY